MNNQEESKREKAILVGVKLPHQFSWEIEDFLDELSLLADTAGAHVVDRVIQSRDKIDPAYYIGRGKAKEIYGQVKSRGIGIVIFDDDLSPAQVRNLESCIGIKILDRSGLILDIFAIHARTREAKIQVELAQLKYLFPRLTRRWPHLSRQEGGIGTRGPGETQLEVDKRVIKRKIKKLQGELQKIECQREIRRKRRADIFKVAIIGYTNAGKSTILNTLSNSNIFVGDRLFATLDTTVRAVNLPHGQKVLISDTVGFIRKLPPHLIASFRSTLKETIDADLLIEVIDLSHPKFEDHIESVSEVLMELEVSSKPTIMVFNKIDKIKEAGLMERVKREYPDSVLISAARCIHINHLREKIVQEVNGRY